MNLLDFKYWISLNESQKTYYTFEIPKRRLTELDEYYLRGLEDLLSESLPESMYDIDRSENIVLTLKSSQDELVSSIYGESEEIKIYLTPPGSSNDNLGRYMNISANLLIDCLKRAHYSKKVSDGEKSVSIRFTALPSQIDQIITSAARCVTPTAEVNKDSFSFLDLIYNNSSDVTKRTDEFRESLNYYLRSLSVKSALQKYLVSETTPNLDEISGNIKSRLEEIKSIDLDALSPEEKELKIKEVLDFQRDILSKSSPKDLESKLTTDALITNFRILLKEFGGVKEIEKALK